MLSINIVTDGTHAGETGLLPCVPSALLPLLASQDLLPCVPWVPNWSDFSTTFLRKCLYLKEILHIIIYMVCAFGSLLYLGQYITLHSYIFWIVFEIEWKEIELYDFYNVVWISNTFLSYLIIWLDSPGRCCFRNQSYSTNIMKYLKKEHGYKLCEYS